MHDLRPEAASSGSRPRWRDQWRGCFPAADQRLARQPVCARTRQAALETRPSGVPSRWHNPSTGNAGAITPIRTDRSAAGIYCREYQLTVTPGGVAQASPRQCLPPARPRVAGIELTPRSPGAAYSTREGRRSIQPSLHGPTAPANPVPIRHQERGLEPEVGQGRIPERVPRPVPGIHGNPGDRHARSERDIRDIPLSQLELSPGNVRKTPADASAFTELKASIAPPGLLENLICPRHGTRSGWRRALRRDRRRSAVGCDAGAGRRGRAGRGSPRALPHDRRYRDGRRSFAGREHCPRRHAPGRSGRGVPPPGRCGQHRGRHRGTLRGLGAHRGETPAARQRRTGAARGLPRGRDRSGHIDGVRRHHGSCAPDRGLGDGQPAGLPARRLADQAPADRRPGSRYIRHRAFRRP